MKSRGKELVEYLIECIEDAGVLFELADPIISIKEYIFEVDKYFRSLDRENEAKSKVQISTSAGWMRMVYQSNLNRRSEITKLRRDRIVNFATDF